MREQLPDLRLVVIVLCIIVLQACFCCICRLEIEAQSQVLLCPGLAIVRIGVGIASLYSSELGPPVTVYF
jgi:hypothetical protein